MKLERARKVEQLRELTNLDLNPGSVTSWPGSLGQVLFFSYFSVLISKMGIAMPTLPVLGKIQHVKPVIQGEAQRKNSMNSSSNHEQRILFNHSVSICP